MDFSTEQLKVSFLADKRAGKRDEILAGKMGLLMVDTLVVLKGFCWVDWKDAGLVVSMERKLAD